MSNFDFNNLFVLDLANNHQGSVEHGLKIIKECGKMVRKHNIRAAMKFQFRQYDTFIHPDSILITGPVVDFTVDVISGCDSLQLRPVSVPDGTPGRSQAAV